MHDPVAKDIQASESRPSEEALKAAVLSFLDSYSIEATPHALEELETYPEFLPAKTTVYVAHPPRSSLADVVDLAHRLRALGYRTVPHIAVRRIEHENEFRDALASYQSIGIDQALLIAGDLSEPVGPYHNTMQVLETGLLPAHGLNTVGIAGHPEGDRAVGPTILRKALHDKAQFAADTGLRMYIVTQFGFNARAVADWELATSADGIDLPVHVGMAGQVPIKELLRYAIRCGISSSMRMLVSKASAMSDQVKLVSVDALIPRFASHILSHPECRMSRAHFYAFGGAERTVRWLNAVRAGRFEVAGDDYSISLTE